MKRFALVPAALLAACFAVDQKPETANEPPNKQADTSANEFMAAVERLKMADLAMMGQIDRMTKKYDERMQLIDQRLEKLEAGLTMLIQDWKNVTQGANKPSPVDPGPKPVDPKPVKPAKDPIEVLAGATDRMKRSEISKEDLAQLAADLAPISNQAVNKFLDELKQNMDNPTYVKNFHGLMAGFAPEHVRLSFSDALKEIRLRGLICETIEKSGSLVLSRLLEDFANTPDDNFRAQIGRALVSCKNVAGVPLLLMCLRSNDESLRTIAILTLKRANSGRTLGYDFFLSPTSETNVKAIKEWENWYDQNKDKLFR